MIRQTLETAADAAALASLAVMLWCGHVAAAVGQTVSPDWCGVGIGFRRGMG